MKTVRLKTKKSEESAVVFRKDLSRESAELRAEMLARGGIVLTDSNVDALYGEAIRSSFAGVPVHVMPAGEAHKNERTLLSLLSAMAERELRRNSVLVAFGGGVVGDLGGLAAGLYMRGISCVQIPTTLLAQVDSSVGGKTAVDFLGVKNLIGVFKQPERVIVCPAFLKTLPERELRCGLGEIVKHAALCSPLFGTLQAREDELLDAEFLASVVPQNIAFKAEIVRRDPHETGLRKCLNLGHTTAHALELALKTRSHGECVLLGLLIEGRLAERYTACDGAYLRRLYALCRKALGPIPPFGFPEEAARLALLDKKNFAAGKVTVTAPVAAGKYELLDLPFAEYAREAGRITEELC